MNSITADVAQRRPTDWLHVADGPREFVLRRLAERATRVAALGRGTQENQSEQTVWVHGSKEVRLPCDDLHWSGVLH